MACPLAASDLLVALMRLAPETGRLPDLDLVPAPTAMATRVRLELAELASAGLAALPAAAARPWAERLLELVDAGDASLQQDGDQVASGAIFWPGELQPRRLAAAAEPGRPSPG